MTASSQAISTIDVAARRLDYANRFNATWAMRVTSIVDAGHILLEAKEGPHKLPHGKFVAMVKRDLPISIHTAQALKKIARNPVLSKAVHALLLPPTWTVLVILTRLSDRWLEALIATGEIHPGLRRREALELVKKYADPDDDDPPDPADDDEDTPDPAADDRPSDDDDKPDDKPEPDAEPKPGDDDDRANAQYDKWLEGLAKVTKGAVRCEATWNQGWGNWQKPIPGEAVVAIHRAAHALARLALQFAPRARDVDDLILMAEQQRDDWQKMIDELERKKEE